MIEISSQFDSGAIELTAQGVGGEESDAATNFSRLDGIELEREGGG